MSSDKSLLVSNKHIIQRSRYLTFWGQNSIHILPSITCTSHLFSNKPVDVSEGADETQAALSRSHLHSRRDIITCLQEDRVTGFYNTEGQTLTRVF